jgi:hypothetical protein
MNNAPSVATMPAGITDTDAMHHSGTQADRERPGQVTSG